MMGRMGLGRAMMGLLRGMMVGRSEVESVGDGFVDLEEWEAVRYLYSNVLFLAQLGMHRSMSSYIRPYSADTSNSFNLYIESSAALLTHTYKMMPSYQRV
jgi:hypothetical protein